MSRSKIILTGAVVLAVAILLFTLSPQAFFRTQQSPGGAMGEGFTGVPGTPTSDLPGFGNAFAPGIETGSLAGNPYQTPIFEGKPVTSLNDVLNIIESAPSAVSAPSTPAPSGPELLAWPAIPDSEIAIDPSGVSTVPDFLSYFNEHSVKDIVFDASRLSGVLKDTNGVVLLVPSLIDKALADNNFSEVHSSLAIQQDFANAEVAFLKKIKVTGDAVALDKQTIGSEELLVDLISKAFAVESGTLSQSDLSDYYQKFLATMASGRQNVLVQSGALSLDSPNIGSWLSGIFRALNPTAEAFTAGSPTGNQPFGGKILAPIPCLCALGYWVIVGLPRPASLFVPFAFLSTPLFFEFKSLTPGVWWLGLYNKYITVPCAEPPFCTPMGFGKEIIMTGTSLIPIKTK